jgi:hypothetical protein
MIELVLLLAGPVLPSAEPPVAALREARDLLNARKHAELTTLVEARQAAVTKDPTKGSQLDWTLNAFRLDMAEIPGLIEEWITASPRSWAPLLARAVNRGKRAALARGERSASRTSDDQFRRMAELHAGMRADCRMVLSRNRAVCPCYEELVLAAKHGSRERDPQIDQAFEVAHRTIPCTWSTSLGWRLGGADRTSKCGWRSSPHDGVDSTPIR